MNDATLLRSAQIKRLAGLSNVVTALLGAVDTMLPADQDGALQLCADLADNVAGGLDNLLDGAA